MNFSLSASRQRKLCLAMIGLLAWSATRAEAGGLFRRRGRSLVPTTATVAPAAPAPFPTTLGTFSPTPAMVVRGSFPTGGGYSPNDSYGDTSMDIYGPLSAFRNTSAPVMTYTRGYDGRTQVLEGTSFSSPNLPGNSPVVYPTQSTYFYGFGYSKNPPWWPKATNWIDQN